MADLERVWHSLLSGGSPADGEAANTTLEILRFDGLGYDWNDGTFKALGTETTAQQAATELDATNKPGIYYWDLGAGSTVNGLFPAVFTNGMYTFIIQNSTLGYYQGWSQDILNRRAAVRYPGDRLKAKKVLSEGATDNLVLYEEDGSTVMETISVADKTAGAISLDSGVPARETPS